MSEWEKILKKHLTRKCVHLVCAQCHVEYYFDKNRPGAEGSAYLTFPWDKGFSVEDMEEYYDEIEFKDWTHAIE